MRFLGPLALLLGVTIALVVSGCAKKVETKTETTTHTVTDAGKTQTVQTPIPPRVVTVQAPPPRPPALRPLPPAGVYQVGDHVFLVRRGYEQNMHHLCDGDVPNDSTGSRITVDRVDSVGNDFEVVCSDSVGRKYRDLALIPIPSGVRQGRAQPHSHHDNHHP